MIKPVLLSLCLLQAVGLAFADDAPFNLEAWLAKKDPAYMATLAVSADGKWIAVTMQGFVKEGAAPSASSPREAGIYQAASDDAAGSEIYIVERATGKVSRPFQNFVGSYAPVWSPIGLKLALAVQDAPTRYPRLATWTPGQAEPHIWPDARFHPVVGFTAPAWTPDGNWLVFPYVLPPLPVKRLAETDVSAAPGHAPVATPSAETLAVLDVASGKIRPFHGLGPYEYARVWGFRLSPDGRKVAFLAQAPPRQQGVEVNWDRLTIVDLDSGAVQAVGESQPEGWGLGLSWSPDGKRIAWHAAPGPEDSPAHPESLFLAALDSAPALKELPWEKADWGGQLHSVDDIPQAPPVWSADSSSFWIAGKDVLHHFSREGDRLADVALPAAKGGAEWLENNSYSFAPVRTQTVFGSGVLWVQRRNAVDEIDIKTAPPTAKTVTVSAGPERAIDWSSNTVFFLKDIGNHGWELWTASLADGQSARLAVLTPSLPEFAHGPIRTLSWKLTNGSNCQGTLLLPAGWKEGDRPPVVMDVYGADTKQGGQGAHSIGEACNIINPFLLAAHGYAFFKPDMPQEAAAPAASLGRSADAAADALKASGLVDDGRIAIVGQSYGGYTALSALTSSTRFKAGIVANGVYDLIRYDTDGPYSADWVENGQVQIGADVWEKKQRYMDNSPLMALDKLQAPLLVLQGDGDELSHDQGPALANALQRLNKPATILVGAEMDHVPISWTAEIQRELDPKIIDFLDRNLKR